MVPLNDEDKISIARVLVSTTGHRVETDVLAELATMRARMSTEHRTIVDVAMTVLGHGVDPTITRLMLVLSNGKLRMVGELLSALGGDGKARLDAWLANYGRS